MSNGLAISAVTYVLQYHLVNLYHGTGLPFTNPVNVTCLAPDQVQNNLGDISGPENQVNLFLHQVTRNAAWRNADLPSLAADGKTRLKNPPLALDLHYLLTVYGSEDWQAEALLGYALMMLHENPVLARADIANALTALTTIPEPYPTNPLTPVLGASGLADQIEMLKITPEILGREEMAWLWTALKADYRPTFPFQVTVVLLQPQQPTSLALPVLRRRVDAQPMQPAQISRVQPPGGQIAAASTDTVTVTGEFLNGVSQVALSNPRYGAPYTVPVAAASYTSFTFVPNASLTHPAGAYSLAAQFLDAAGIVVQSTSPMPFALAPTLPTQVAGVVANADGSLITVSFTPDAREGQDVSLALSAITPPPPGTALFTCSAAAQPFSGSTGTLSFQFPPTLPTGALLGRLRVDGVTSQIEVDLSAHPPTFTGPLVTI
jgi:Pvc16 N-terminal domain